MKKKVGSVTPRVNTIREEKIKLESISGPDSIIDYSAKKGGARRVMASMKNKYDR
jgi:hypothetical protein